MKHMFSGSSLLFVLVVSSVSAEEAILRYCARMHADCIIQTGQVDESLPSMDVSSIGISAAAAREDYRDPSVSWADANQDLPGLAELRQSLR